MMGYKGMKTIMQEQDKKQIEDKIFNLLRDKWELERKVKVGEHARMELEELDKKLNNCYTKLCNNWECTKGDESQLEKVKFIGIKDLEYLIDALETNNAYIVKMEVLVNNALYLNNTLRFNARKRLRELE